MRNTQEIAWRHFWLKNVLIDAGKPLPAKICRPSSRENLSSAGNQADVIGAASGKTSLDASDPRTAAIMDGMN